MLMWRVFSSLVGRKKNTRSAIDKTAAWVGGSVGKKNIQM